MQSTVTVYSCHVIADVWIEQRLCQLPYQQIPSSYIEYNSVSDIFLADEACLRIEYYYLKPRAHVTRLFYVVFQPDYGMSRQPCLRTSAIFYPRILEGGFKYLDLSESAASTSEHGPVQ